jgi:general secretion pathway protein F
VQFSNELIALLEAGLSLVEAIDALTEKERDDAIRNVLEGIRKRLYEGQSLSVALSEFPSSFPPLYVATVRASERSGAIPEALRRFVAYQEQIDILKKRLINASIYPAVLLAAGTLVVLFLVGFVVPRFAGIYEDIGGELPLASRILMQWGRLLAAHGTAVLVTFIVVSVVGVRSVMRPEFRAAVGRAIARIPTIGRQIELYQLARLYRTVGMLLRGGLPVVTAFEMTRGLLAAASQPRLAAATRAVREGKSMTDSLASQGLTTPVAERMLRVGERSGNMGEMMERIAAFYDEELSRFVEVATRLIEPAMMTVIGLVIGLVVVLMYFPIFELAGSIR